MSLFQGGVRLQLFVGPTLPVPAPVHVMSALEQVEVTHSDEGRSGFSIRLKAGRSGPLGLVDNPLLLDPLLKPFNRVLMIVIVGAVPRVLMDGIITNQELSPGEQPGSSTMTLVGEDVSVMMDLHERSAEHVAQDETLVVTKTILSYMQYGLTPVVMPPPAIDVPIPLERVPVQQETDLQHLCNLAERYGYVFYVTPGPLPGQNTAYWGPPGRLSVPQKALTSNAGADTNLLSIRFRNDALGPTTIEGRVQDRQTNLTMPVVTFAALRPPLALLPSVLVNQPNVRREQMRSGGLSIVQAFARAQGRTDAAADAVTAEGELDAVRYGDVLQARGLVGVRGVGATYDGLYYVKQVTHSIRVGEYKQSFTLKREGVGTTVPAVRP